MQNAAIGFDLGTTISVASAVDRSGKPVPIRGAVGSHLIPSAIYFDTNVVVGESALELGLQDPEGLSEAFKRDIGKPHYSRDIRSFKVPPEVLTAFLIRHMLDNVRSSLGDVSEVVITVPAFFDEKKRTATQQSAQMAGVKVADIINEPTAAAIAAGYEMLKSNAAGSQPKKLLVYDLGGGTFDATLLELSDRTFRALSTDGDIYLGGRDFDERILSIIAERFVQKHGVDPRVDPRKLQRLWRLARDVKHDLTGHDSAPVYFEHMGLVLDFELSRTEFEDAIEPLIERSISTTEDALREAKSTWKDIDEFLLVGGSSRVPLVAKKAAQYWGREPKLVDNPDELIAHGAALYAAAKQGDKFLDGSSRFNVVNVNAHSLGIQGIDTATKQEINKILIPRNTPLPASKTRSFVTHRDGMKNVKVRLLEGESENPKFCTRLGDCVVKIDPPMPKGSEVSVTCNYLANGTISVTAKLPKSNSSAYVELRRDGYTTLDSLDVWMARLTSGGDDLRSTEVLARDPSRPSLSANVDRESNGNILQRLDEIYLYVGKLASDSTPPSGAVQTHRLVGKLTDETNTLRQLIERLERQHQKSVDFQSRFEISGRLAQIKMTWEHSMQLLDHSRVALGRECISEGLTVSDAGSFVEEARELQSILDG